MKRLGLNVSIIVILAVAACAKSPTPETGTPEPATPETGTPEATPPPDPAQPLMQQGQALVAQLPDGAEGLELRDGALRVKDGYTFEQQPGGTFKITRMSDGTTVTQGSCECGSGSTGTCAPVMKGGYIVCEGTCSDCGLDLTVGDVRTEIMRFTK